MCLVIFKNQYALQLYSFQAHIRVFFFLFVWTLPCNLNVYVLQQTERVRYIICKTDETSLYKGMSSYCDREESDSPVNSIYNASFHHAVFSVSQFPCNSLLTLQHSWLLSEWISSTLPPLKLRGITSNCVVSEVRVKNNDCKCSLIF